MNFIFKKGFRESVKITQTTVFDQQKLVFQKLELILKLSKVLIILGSFSFYFKVVAQIALKGNYLEFCRFEYFFGFLAKLFYVSLVDYMYDLIGSLFAIVVNVEIADLR